MSLSFVAPPADAPADGMLDGVAAGDGWWGKWRGVQAWELTIETPIAVGLIMLSIMRGDRFVVDALVQLIPLITVYLTARYAVLGVHVYRGSQERQIAMQTRSSRAD